MGRSVDLKFKVVHPHFDYDFHPGDGMLRLCGHETSRGEKWWSGDFVDQRGIVSIQQEAKLLRLDAVVNGRCCVRTWRGRYFGQRTVARLCRSFLTDCLTATRKGPTS